MKLGPKRSTEASFAVMLSRSRDLRRTIEFSIYYQYMPFIRFLLLNNGETDTKQERDKVAAVKSLQNFTF